MQNLIGDLTRLVSYICMRYLRDSDNRHKIAKCDLSTLVKEQRSLFYASDAI